MTILNEHQEQLLEGVKSTYEEVMPTLYKLEEDYEYATYLAKKAIRDAVELAEQGGVPFSRITQVMQFNYPQKLKAWLRPSDSVVDRLVYDSTNKEEPDVGVFEEDLLNLQSVFRDPKTGVFSVQYEGREYQVPATGPDTEPWTSRDENIPQGVYDMISEKYPGFVALDDDDEE